MAEHRVSAISRLSNWTLLAYALPALPLAALTLPLYMVVPTFYAEALGLPLAGIGTVLLLVRIFDAVNDPLIGHFADRLRGPLGLRRSWLAFSALPVAIAAYFMFWPPVTAGLIHLFVAGIALSIGYTAMILPISAWGAELSSDTHEKSRIVAWREGLVLAGTLFAIALPFTVGWEDANSFHGLAMVAVFVAVLLPLTTLISVISVPAPEAKKANNASFRASISVIKTDNAFRRLLAAFFINATANALPATLFLIFVTQRLDADASRGPLLLLYFASAIIGIPIWTWASKRFGKSRTWCVAMVLACFLFLPAWFLGTGDVAAFTVICVLTGLCLGADLVLPASMQADVIEADKERSGTSRAAFYFALWSLATKLALALAVGSTFPILDWSGLDAADVTNTSESGLVALSALYALVPIALKAIAISIVWGFTIDVSKAQPEPA